MRTSRVGFLAAIASLVACQDSGAPAALNLEGGPMFSRSEQGDQVAGDWVFRFERIVGNDVTGAAGRIRDQNAIGAPWRVDRGDARLSQRGELRVTVEGLVLKSTGGNPIPAFKAILSCLTNAPANTLATVNLSTALFPATADGNVEIRETLSGIPSPCYAPIVFVTNTGGSWAAISGF